MVPSTGLPPIRRCADGVAAPETQSWSAPPWIRRPRLRRPQDLPRGGLGWHAHAGHRRQGGSRGSRVPELPPRRPTLRLPRTNARPGERGPPGLDGLSRLALPSRVGYAGRFRQSWLSRLRPREVAPGPAPGHGRAATRGRPRRAGRRDLGGSLLGAVPRLRCRGAGVLVRVDTAPAHVVRPFRASAGGSWSARYLLCAVALTGAHDWQSMFGSQARALPRSGCSTWFADPRRSSRPRWAFTVTRCGHGMAARSCLPPDRLGSRLNFVDEQRTAREATRSCFGIRPSLFPRRFPPMDDRFCIRLKSPDRERTFACARWTRRELRPSWSTAWHARFSRGFLPTAVGSPM